ncbi:MAG: class I SAM-dependent methyltransferase, partial [Clostridia bacterium]|nr:class I SAM-dependent methyltransferase [Clostridia bacterium]MBR5978880.1 class I SAM-dependent methyltransferase [Verrucomicrobiota bacterium]
MKFDQYAETYDAGWRGTKSARFYEDLIKELEINPGDAVLDVGCGTGTVLKFISSKTEIKGYGLDISPQMLEVARKKNPGFEF